MADVEVMDLSTVGRSANLDSCANVALVWINSQNTSDTGRIVEVSPFMPNHE